MHVCIMQKGTALRNLKTMPLDLFLAGSRELLFFGRDNFGRDSFVQIRYVNKFGLEF